MNSYVVILTAQSMSECGAYRCFELPIEAANEEQAIEKIKKETEKFTVYNTSYRIKGR